MFNFNAKSKAMGLVKTRKKLAGKAVSTFALLVDDINKMSESQQKLLWLQINKDKVSALSEELDDSVTSHSLSQGEIDSLINEAKKHVRKKKKG
jgi:hypothetical protein